MAKNKSGNISGVISPRILLPLGAAGLLIFIISAYIEYRIRSSDYIRLLRRQSELAVETLYNTAANNLTAAEVLEAEISQDYLAKLHLVDRMDRRSPLTPEELRSYLALIKMDAILFYNEDGTERLQASKQSGGGRLIPDEVIWEALINETGESIVALSDSNSGRGEDYLGILVRRQGGGIIAGILSSAQIHYFRQTFGFGKLLQNFQMSEGIEYIALENQQTIAAGVLNGYQISSFRDDPFLINIMNGNIIGTRTLRYGSNLIFESVAPFDIPETFTGVLRMGLSMREYENLAARAKKNIIILGGIIFILALIFTGFFISHRQRILFRDELIRHQEYTNVILGDLGSGVIALDKDGTIEAANKKAVQILGLDPTGIPGLSYTCLPEFLTSVVRMSLAEEHPAPVFRRGWITSGIGQKHLSVRSSQARYKDQSIYSILLIDDITEQTMLETQIHRNEKLTAMGKLASTVAHEIRNPLNSIHLIIKYLAKKYQPMETGENYGEYFDSLSGEIDRINTIINQFMTFARPPELTCAELKFGDLWKELEILFRLKMEKHGISFAINIEDHAPFRGDREKLKQVFINIIENAYQAITPPGVIRITGKTDGNLYEIACQDSGCGIGEQDLRHVFDLYFTTKKNGNGIGLAVAQQIVSLHNGTISIESRTGSGTTITIRFMLDTILLEK